MRRLGFTLVLTFIATAAGAGDWNNIDGDQCTSSHFRIDGRRAHVIEETIDAADLRTIAVRNVPVKVEGGNARGYTITVCKAAKDPADLADIHVSVEGGKLVTRGPDHDDWTITYHITAPEHGATLDIESRNGPLRLRDLDGTFTIKLQNGPLALDSVRGTVDAETTNGPVSIHGGSGNMKVQASNGPISVSLEGGSWEGGTLEASTENGPLSVRVPRSFNSGVLVEAEGHGPVSCRAEACEGQYRARHRGGWDDDEPRRFEFGRGPQVVKLSTVNGPLTIKDAE